MRTKQTYIEQARSIVRRSFLLSHKQVERLQTLLTSECTESFWNHLICIWYNIPLERKKLYVSEVPHFESLLSFESEVEEKNCLC